MKMQQLLALTVLFSALILASEAKSIVFKEVLVTEESEELDDETEADMRILLDSAISQLVSPDEPEGGHCSCGGGKCSCCAKIITEVCIVAAVVKNGVEVTATVAGKTVFHTEVTVPDPPEFCFLKKEVCVKVYNINFKAHSLCVKATFNYKFIHTTKDFGCFTIPVKEEVDLGPAAQSPVQISNQDFKSLEPVSDVNSTTDILSDLQSSLNDIFGDFLTDGLDGGKCSCGGEKCSCCAHVVTDVCVIGSIIPKGLDISATAAGKTVFHKEITVPDPPEFCFLKKEVCVKVYNVNFQKHSACIRAKFSYKVIHVTKELGCFTIPVDEVTYANQALEQQAPEETFTSDAALLEPSEERDMDTRLRFQPPENVVADNYIVINEADEVIPLEDLLSALEELPLDGGHCGCKSGKCSCCLNMHVKKWHLDICLELGVVKEDFGVEAALTVNGHNVFKKEISLRNPPAICPGSLPGISKLVKLCIKFHDIDFNKKSACVAGEIKVLVKKWKFELGCFHF